MLHAQTPRLPERETRRGNLLNCPRRVQSWNVMRLVPGEKFCNGSEQFGKRARVPYGELNSMNMKTAAAKARMSPKSMSSFSSGTTLPHHEPPAHPQIEIHTCIFMVGRNCTSDCASVLLCVGVPPSSLPSHSPTWLL